MMPKTIETTKASTTEIRAITRVLTKACSTSPGHGDVVGDRHAEIADEALPSQMKYWTSTGLIEAVGGAEPRGVFGAGGRRQQVLDRIAGGDLDQGEADDA